MGSIYDKIGTGRTSAVYKGRKRQSIDYCAVKKTPKEEKTYLLQKIKFLHALDHPQIMHFYGWYETQNHLWMLLEYCGGGNLEELVIQEARLPMSTIQEFTHQIAITLTHLHAKDIIYMELNPKTILLNTQGKLKLGGFGAAVKIGQKIQEGGEERRLFFPPAPETARRTSLGASPALDAWSLGCLIHYMAVGQKPVFDKRSVYDPKLLKGVNKDVADLIRQLLSKSPKKRPSFEAILHHPFLPAAC